MKESCDIKNPLVRDGSSQKGRMLKSLAPDFVRVDERSVADILCLAKGYAEKLQYYNSSNSPEGDWRAFIEHDLSAVVSLVAVKDLTLFREAALRTTGLLGKAATPEEDLKRALKTFFDLSFTLAVEIDGWYGKGQEGMRLSREVHRIISAQLADPLRRLIAYFKCARKEALIADQPIAAPEFPAESLMNVQDLLKTPFHDIWMAAGSDASLTWKAYTDSVAEDCTPFASETDSKAVRIRSAADAIASLFEEFYKAQAELIHKAPDFLAETIANWPGHEPHMTLLITFIQLFRHAQDSINTITQRHLDFYYKDVLRFSEKEAIADKVHVLAEPAKQTISHLLKEGSLLKAGKDTTGVNVFYRTDTDLVVNRAKVDALKAVFIDRNDSWRIYSAPVANSGDGRGADFETEEPKWRPFGESQRDPLSGKYLEADKRTMDFARVGCAISSPLLFLKEGMRTVTVTFRYSSVSGIGKDELTDLFAAAFSGAKEWISVEPTVTDVNSFANTITLQCVLGVEQPPVVAFDGKALGGAYGSGIPVLKISLKNRARKTPPFGYELLKDLEVKGVEMAVSVMGVKDLIIQHDSGLADPSKPFLPFGAQPSVGSGLYLGSAEIFQKRLTSLSITLEWKDVPASDLGAYYGVYDTLTNDSFEGQVSILYNHGWHTLGSSISLFNTDDALQDQTLTYTDTPGDFNALTGYGPGMISDPLSAYGHDTKRGFIRLELTAPPMAFGHRKYRDLYAKSVIKFAASPTDANAALIPKDPYTPQIATLTVNYDAVEEITLPSSSDGALRRSTFYHLYPFGEVEKDTVTSWLPGFETRVDEVDQENEGELYIGISGLEPRQNLSLLFQVAEGSADPELNKAQVYWSYLGKKGWVPFENNEILLDSTSGLLTSGIIRFDIPKKAVSDNPLLPEKFHWLRASVLKNSGAICDLIDVLAQAVQASFVDSGNDPEYLANPLPAESIGKLKVKDGAIKSVAQPYASWGGRMKEESSHFYTRVSERLRHKERGVTIWDYEKLVLEKFPAIFKVKCINHSAYNYEKGGLKITSSEFAPGYVTVIVVPDLTNRNAVDPLEPRASLGMLEEIKGFLKGIISPFAAETLQVINPLYEKVQVEFGVQFRSGFDRGFYEGRLKEEIKAYLSPWISGKGEEIVFGGRVHKSVILNFVEELAYVDFVTEFKMNHIIEAVSGTAFRGDVDEAIPTTARSILVSHKEHVIKEASCS